jgi:hypothetical protein
VGEKLEEKTLLWEECKKQVQLKPEEVVRQLFLMVLNEEYVYIWYTFSFAFFDIY